MADFFDELASAGSGQVPSSAAGAGSTRASVSGPRYWYGTPEDGEPLVYIGTGKSTLGGVSVPRPGRKITTPYGFSWEKGASQYTTQGSTRDEDALPYSMAEQQIYRWYGTENYDRWGDLAVDLGFVAPENRRDLNELDKWWRQAVETATMFTQNGRLTTPWQALRMMAGDEDAIAARTGGGGGGGTQRSTSIDLTSPEDARYLINNVLSQSLGRRATDEEIETFTNTLHAAQRKNPTVSTNTWDAEGNSSTVTSGGLSAAAQGAMVEEGAMELPEYGQFQAATTYANALFAALDSPV